MSDRLLSGFGAIVRALLPSLTAYVVWSYRVVSVTSATPPIKIDCKPVSNLCPYGPQAGMTLWPGPSGTVAVPQVGSLVRLAFADADPAQPMIVGLDPSAPPMMVYVGEDTGPFAARVGDGVEVSAAAASSPGIIITAPNGTCTISVGPGGYKLTGTITSGSSKVQVP